MRKLIYAFFMFLYFQNMTAQTLPKAAYELYPTLQDMQGYAYGSWQDKVIIFGGVIKSEILNDKSTFPNLEIILIDLGKKRASAFNSGNLQGILGEQMAATGLAFYQKGKMLYIAGGYGYSEEAHRFITFPNFTAIDLEATIPALLAGKNPVAYFYQICDERIAVYDGVLDHNGDEFFLINGKYAYKLQPFEDKPTYFEESREGEGATFQLAGEGKSLNIKAFKNWYDLQDMLDYYSTNMPAKAQQEAEKTIRKKNDQ